jgi:hypothetical protein
MRLGRVSRHVQRHVVRMKRRKTGRPRIEDRAKTIEARKPWLKLEMSRRTWYRRQAEKRDRPQDQKS